MTTAGGAGSKIKSLLLHHDERSSTASSHAAGKERKKNQLSLQSLEEAAAQGRMELTAQLTPAVFVLHLDTLVPAVRLRTHTHTHTVPVKPCSSAD